jgi:D-alanyl-D-alanine carboxypeptidase/D-alanyl-D-alanine-endopeptidase (penicillin-binding protein 4)
MGRSHGIISSLFSVCAMKEYFRSYIKGIVVLGVTLWAGAAFSQTVPEPVIASLERANLPPSAVSIDVREVSSESPWISWQPHLPQNPASAMKLVTTQAALDVLGPGYAWKTQAYATGARKGDVLYGDLIIKGSGDPKLVLENFWLFLRQIRIRGIREIRGNVLLDRSAFEQSSFDAALFDGEPLRSYNAGPDALLLNYKAISYRFVPDPDNGRVRIMMDPPLARHSVKAPKLVSGDCGDWQKRLGAEFDVTRTHFRGNYALACGERVWHVHPYHMTNNQFFGGVFRQVWKDLGGVFKGEVRDGVVTSDAYLVAEWQSVTLAEVVRDINKYSNNVMARQLLLTMAFEATQSPATPQLGAAVVRASLQNRGIEASELVLENGAGLSRNARISADSLGRLLVSGFRSATMPEFVASMPVVGYDGTMKRRLTDAGVARSAHIKTGLLADVRAIAGYVLAASGRRYSVVFLINHPRAPAGWEAQDALLQWIYEKG